VTKPGPDRRAAVLGELREAVQIALSAIFAYKLRAGLTILGVVMGIMTVTGMSSIVAGLNASMASQIEGLGSSTVFIRPMGPGENLSRAEQRRRKGLSREEIEALEKLPLLAGVCAIELVRADLIKYGRQRLSSAQTLGTNEAFESVHDSFVSRGRFITRADTTRRNRVAVIGPDIVDALFPFLDPLDKELNIDGRRFRVIGVLERKGKFLGQSRDNYVLVPLGTLQRTAFLKTLVADVKVVSPEKLNEAVDSVIETLRRKRKLGFLEDNNFVIFTQDTLTDLYGQITGGIYAVMIAISSIGLMVGGVGVMNIMLVSVTERTREIGVRKALGAKRRDILWQFLTEAMTLTGVGGLLGIAMGGAIAALVNAFSPFPAVLQPTWVALAFGTSMAVGLVFGMWPAAKASRLDPIEALRYE